MGLGIRGRLLIAGLTALVVLACFGIAAIVERLTAPWSWIVIAVGVWLLAEGMIRAIIWGANRWA